MNGSSGKSRPPRALVVFDVNVYLDVARLMGGPFSWEDFKARASTHAADPNPHSTNAQIDSLRAIAISLSGRYEVGSGLEVWFGKHLDDTTFHKLTQRVDGGSRSEDCGLGWSNDHANDFMEQFVDRIRDDNGGGFLEGHAIPYESPPLDHEDGCVYATARHAGTEDYFYERFCVTRDHDFRAAGPELNGNIEVMYPHEWLTHVRDKMNTANPFQRMMQAAS